jgi:asparagine synthase (glutamine-hydrolysing)
MCGIAGYWSVSPLSLEDLAVATDLLAHRGPDGFGYLTADEGRLGLGHRRLAILDPRDTAAQPMLSDDRRYAIVFNGEIYNFLEIRDELRSKGHVFRSESDTEVVLHAYAEWGSACQARFNGMWAFAVWDDAERQLFLSRDRFGVKPLLLVETPSGTAFASEAKAFAGLPWGTGASTRDDSGSDGASPPRVRVLRGGMCATLKGPTARLDVVRWWQPLDHIRPGATSYPQQVERFRELFFDACRLRLRSDVPIATAISGGLDSSSTLAAVYALGAEAVARRPSDWTRAFTIVAPGTQHDELRYAMATCSAVGVEPTVIDLFERCDPNDIDEYLYLTEGRPLTNLPAWYLYRTMREHGIPVSIDGQGADEILIGYAIDAIRALQLEGSWLRRPRRTRDLYRTITEQAQNSPYARVRTRMLLVSSSPALRRIASRPERIRSRIPAVLEVGHDAPTWEMARTLPAVNAVAFMAVHDGIQRLLERYDVLSMSSGLEIRMPFLDWRLVCYALSLPGESIVGDGFMKRILRDAMAPYLPEVVRTRKQKLQFQGPIRSLLQNQLSPWLDRYPSLRAAGTDVLATGAYPEVSEFGFRLVDAWQEQTYPRMLDDRVAAIRARHRADPGPIRTHTHTL